MANKNKRGDLLTLYLATITFTDEQGGPQRAPILPGHQDNNFPIGTEMDIRYNPYDPSHIKSDRWFDLWGVGAIFLMVGFGIFAYVVFARQQNKKTEVHCVK